MLRLPPQQREGLVGSAPGRHHDDPLRLTDQVACRESPFEEHLIISVRVRNPIDVLLEHFRRAALDRRRAAEKMLHVLAQARDLVIERSAHRTMMTTHSAGQPRFPRARDDPDGTLATCTERDGRPGVPHPAHDLQSEATLVMGRTLGFRVGDAGLEPTTSTV